jgi:VWFA-related protein
MKPIRGPIAAFFVALLVPLGVLAIQQAPVLRILYPSDGGYVSGPTRLRAEIVPQPKGLATVSFFVNQRLVCSVERPPYECSWDAGIGIIARQIRVVAQIAGGPRLTASVQTKGEAFTWVETVERVRVPVVVTNGGRYVDGLTREAFRIQEDGVEQRITDCHPGDAPLDLIVAVDVSGSMTAAMPKVKAAVTQFLVALESKPSDKVWLFGFNDNPMLLARPASDLQARLRAVDLLAPWGMTSFRDILSRLLEMIAGGDGRLALVVFTDGDDTASHLSRQALEAQAERSDASLYLIAQGRGLEDTDLKQVLERLADKSGGLAFFPDRVEQLAGVFGNIVRDLAHQYVLGYIPQTDDYGVHTLRVSVGNGKYKVRARQTRRRSLPGKK